MIGLAFGGFGVFVQVLICVQAILSAPKARQMFLDYGVQLTTITMAFLTTYRLWGVLPLLSAVFLFAVSQNDDDRPSRVWLVAMGILAVALWLEAWTVLALFVPLFRVAEQLK